MVAPVTSIKHYVHRANTSVASGAIHTEVVVDAVVAPATTNAFDVVQGSLVKAIHVEYWLVNQGASSNITQFVFIVEKVPANQASVTAAQILGLGSYPNKKNVLFSSQGNMTPSVDGQASLPVIRNWLLIPKGKQRMGLADRIVVSMAPVGQIIGFCGISTYKEYT